MKQLRKTILASLCATLLCGSLPARGFNDAERAAMTSMKEYLRTKGISSSVDSKDNSLNFLRKDSQGREILYWITFEGNATSMLFNLHRKPIKMVSEKDDPERTSRRLENATLAAEYVTARNAYKAFVNSGKVEFQFPVYAADARDYQKVFNKVLSALGDAQSSFDACYKRAKAYNDSVHMYWQRNDTSKIVVPQPVKGDVKAVKNLSISGIQMRNVDASGAVISDWDEGLRKSKARFIQPRVIMSSAKNGTYKVGVKIITPGGKTLVPTPQSVFSTITTVQIPKANKAAEYELLKFGDREGSVWEAGEYRILFYEDDREIYDDSFTIL